MFQRRKKSNFFFKFDCVYPISTTTLLISSPLKIEVPPSLRQHQCYISPPPRIEAPCSADKAKAEIPVQRHADHTSTPCIDRGLLSVVDEQCRGQHYCSAPTRQYLILHQCENVTPGMAPSSLSFGSPLNSSGPTFCLCTTLDFGKIIILTDCLRKSNVHCAHFAKELMFLLT